MSKTPWGPKTHDLVLSNGQTVTLRDSLPLLSLVASGKINEEQYKLLSGEADAEAVSPADQAALFQLVARVSLVKPRIVANESDADGEETILFEWLTDDDVSEIIGDIFDIEQETQDAVATFRADGTSDADSDDGEVLESKPKSTAKRTAKRNGSTDA